MLTADSDKLLAGEDWCIVGTLLNRDGNPPDLTDALIEWTLLDQSGAPVGASTISAVLDPPSAGIVLVNLAAATTAALAPGYYTDELRVTRSGRMSHGLSTLVVAMHPLSS
jgi:hypothetical protein